MTWLPPNQMTAAMAVAERTSTTGIVNRVRQDRVFERVHVGAVDLLELLVRASFRD